MDEFLIAELDRFEQDRHKDDEANLREYIQGGKNKETLRKNENNAIKIFEWTQTQGNSTPIEQLPHKKLDALLGNYIMGLKLQGKKA